MDNPSLKGLEKVLYDFFIMNSHVYAIQDDNGLYRTVRDKLSEKVLRKMLETEGSLLTYQESSGYVKWVCFDFDIKKGFDNENIKNQKYLFDSVNQLINILKAEGINFLIECSGNRGIHIWIIFEKNVPKSQAFYFISSFKNRIINLPDCIAIDLFPKTYASVSKKSKGLGFGVKIPLSKHKKSNKYSFFFRDESEITMDKESWPKILDDKFILNQIEILNNYNKFSFDLKFISDVVFEKNKNIKFVSVSNETTLTTILSDLSSCNCLNPIVKNVDNVLENDERVLLTGLLSRISKENDKDFGRNVLFEFFSRLPDFKKDVTEKKIAVLSNLYPLKCVSIIKRFHPNCNGCICENKKSPLEAIPGITIIEDFDIFYLDEKIFDNVKKSQLSYIDYNDEIAIHHYKYSISSFKYDKFLKLWNDLKKGYFKVDDEVYEFKRNESIDKERILTAISPQDKLLTTFAINTINNIWFDSISLNSYSYKINPNFNSGWIFSNWLHAWSDFIGKVRGIVFNGDFDDYSSLKIDLKSFYESIDLDRLLIKLVDEPVKTVKERLSLLNVEDLNAYKNIIRYLISVSKKASPISGLPQGPAYARVLAEIYLIGLDELINNLIDKTTDFYYRYVDDIFIFIQDEKQADYVYGEVEKWLSLNSLKVNTRKTKRCKVFDLKELGVLSNKDGDDKYEINKIQSNHTLSTKKEIAISVSKAKKLIRNTEFGLKDNFRFVFSKFKGDKSLDKEKMISAPLIMKNTFGRGSLYRVFFKDYFLLNMQILDYDKFNVLNDLAKEVYLNELLEVDIDNAEQIVHLRIFLTKCIFDYQLGVNGFVSLFQLALRYRISFDQAFTNKVPHSSLRSIICSSEIFELDESVFSIDLLSRIYSSYQNFDDFFESFYDALINNDISIKGLRYFSQYFWVRISENDFSFFKINKVDLYLFYNLLALCTILLSDFKSTLVKDVWGIFLEEVNKKEVFSNKNYWFKFIRIDDYNKLEVSTVISCITLNVQNGLLDSFKDSFSVVNNFRDIVIAIYKGYINDSALLEDLNLPSDVIERLKKEDPFIEWIYDHNTKMYPSRELCLSNIASNDLLVLNRSNEFLVKTMGDHLVSFGFLENYTEYSNYTSSFDKSNKRKFLNVLFENKSDIEKILAYIELYKAGLDFKNKYNTKGYPNFFYSGAKVDDCFLPEIPFYSQCEFIFDDGISKYPNNIESFCLLILESIYNLKISLFTKNNFYSINFVDEVGNFLFPSNLKRNEDKLKFLISLMHSIPQDFSYLSPRDFDNLWSICLYNTMHDNKIYSFSGFIELYITEHNKLLKKSGEKINPCIPQLLFKPISNIDESSLGVFLEKFFGSFSINEICEYNNYILEKISKNFQDFDLNSFTRIKISVSENEYSNDGLFLNFGSDIYSLQDDNFELKFIDFDTDFELCDLTEDNSDIFNDERMCFALTDHELKYTIIMPRAIQKSYGSMRTRFEIQKNEKDVNFLRLLYDCDEMILPVMDQIEDASRLLLEHHQVKDVSIVKNRIIDWLLLFNKYSIEGSNIETFIIKNNYSLSNLYESILNVVLLHQSIQHSHVECFLEKINELKTSSRVISLKNIDADKNGLMSLIVKADSNLLRSLQLQENFDFDNYCSKEITIISDVGISGIEFRKALRFYCFNYISPNQNEGVSPLTEEQRQSHIKTYNYFDVKDNALFMKNFFSTSKINILCALHTGKFEEMVQKTIQEFFELAKTENPSLKNAPTICFHEINKLTSFNYSDFYDVINYKRRDIFENFVNDQALLDKILNIDSHYKRSIRNINDTNLILRLKSTTKQRFHVFTAKPKSGHLSLFERRPELNE